MNEDWHLLFEKFSEGTLSDEEQLTLSELYESNEEFKGFWFKASGQVSLMATLQSNDELKTFLSSSLFLDKKIKRKKKKKPLLFTFLKVAAIFILITMPTYFFLMKDKLPEIAISTDGFSKYELLLPRNVDLKEEALVLKFKEATVSIKGPATIKLNFDGSFELNKGSAHIVTNPGFNFPVNTPLRKYQDIGTEFGLKVGEKTSEVHVFDGSVQVNESLVNKGQALQSNNLNDQGTDILRGDFYSEQQLFTYINEKKLYEEKVERILEHPDIFEYFDFSKLESAKGEILGLKNSSIKVKSEIITLVDGPYFGAKALSTDVDGAYLSFNIPKNVLENYSIYVNFYYDKYELKPQNLLTDISGNLKLSQTMSWFKKHYMKDGLMTEGFWKYRGLLLIKGKTRKAFSNLEDVTSWSALPKNYSNEFVIGNSKKHNLNFKGRIASIVILKSTDLSAIKKLFNYSD